MECPQRWQKIGTALSGWRALFYHQYEGAKILALMAEQWRKLDEGDAGKALFAKERADRAETQKALVSLLRGDPNGCAEFEKRLVPWICLRLDCACDFLGQVFPEHSKSDPFADVPLGWTDDQAAVWLVTESWLRRYDSWLKLTVLEWLGPFPFYGVEPAAVWLE